MPVAYYNIVPLTKIPLNREQALTYASTTPLVPGAIVAIPLRRQEVFGVVWNVQKKLSFAPEKIKQVTSVVHATPLLDASVRAIASNLARTTHTPLTLVVKTMLPKILRRPKKDVLVVATAKAKNIRTKKPTLTSDQKTVLEGIRKVGSAKPIVLFGVTGSGKTEVFFHLIEDQLAKGKQVIVLIPEIMLSHQHESWFLDRFPGKIALLHSKRTPSERWAMWLAIERGELPIILGPRSAVFAPCPNLGLIIVDEAHDQSFKQAEQVPLYDARDVAIERGYAAHAQVVLASATPRLEDWYKATSGSWHLASLPRRIGSDGFMALPTVHIADMRTELKERNFSPISRQLKKQLDTTLAKGGQAFLLVNRRGFSSFILCRDCGNVPMCPSCTTSLTLHYRGGVATLRCHYCGFNQPSPMVCPKCHSVRLRDFGIGTQKVEAVIRDLFPKARVRRIDKDTVKSAERMQEVYAELTSRAIDIVVGTQMVAKGFDLPNVDLVGIIAADQGLFLPDFRTHEYLLSLYMQVAGRAGRRKPGSVIVQSYRPEHPLWQALATHDLVSFFQGELAQRKLLHLPPFADLVRLVAHAKTPAQAEKTLQNALGTLPASARAQALGPAPAFFQKRHGESIWHVLLRLDTYNPTIIDKLPDTVTVDPFPTTTL